MVLDEERKIRGMQMQLFGSVGVIGSGLDINTAYENAKADILVQLRIKLPVFDGGQRRIAVEKRKAQLKFTEVHNEFQEQSFKQKVHQLAKRLTKYRMSWN